MRPILHLILLPLLIVWALPWTLLGALFGLLCCVTGGGVCRVGRVLEFHGGCLGALLKRAPICGGAAAITLGHTVLARTVTDLDRTRKHELVHVHQYERWGPFFIPAYLLASVYLWLRGYDAYLDNPFEKQAYDEAS